MPAMIASAPAPIAQPGMFDSRSSKNPGGSLVWDLATALTGALGGVPLSVVVVFAASAVASVAGVAATGGVVAGVVVVASFAGSAALAGSALFATVGAGACVPAGGVTAGVASGAFAAGAVDSGGWTAGVVAGALGVAALGVAADGAGVVAGAVVIGVVGAALAGSPALPLASACPAAAPWSDCAARWCASCPRPSSRARRCAFALRAADCSARPHPRSRHPCRCALRATRGPGRGRVPAAGVLSVTAVPMRPPDSRPPAPSAAGAFAATRSRYARQSDACTRTSLVASAGCVDDASATAGTVRIVPVRRRFMFLPSNALSLARNIATSI
jgi:hypothetical protein